MLLYICDICSEILVCYHGRYKCTCHYTIEHVPAEVYLSDRAWAAGLGVYVQSPLGLWCAVSLFSSTGHLKSSNPLFTLQISVELAPVVLVLLPNYRNFAGPLTVFFFKPPKRLKVGFQTACNKTNFCAGTQKEQSPIQS